MEIVIPAYMPDTRLIKLIQEIKSKSDYKVILVDDGSGSEYKPIFNEAQSNGCIVLTHDKNQGKGAALKTAFSYLLHYKLNDGIVCADCDGQHTWMDIHELAEQIPTHPGTILLGCRKFVGKVPFRSLLGNTLTRLIFTLVTGSRIEDTQTGLRGFSSEMLPWLIKLEGNRYEFEMNQLLEAKEAGYGFYCMPIETIYENNNKGSHFNPVKDSIRIYLPIIKFALSSMSCGLIDFVLLFILKRLTGNLLISVVAARLVSSLFNYFLNKNIVFQSASGKRHVTLIKYYALAAGILICNYLMLSAITNLLGISLFWGKLITEGILFIVSYLVQHRLIFRK